MPDVAANSTAPRVLRKGIEKVERRSSAHVRARIQNGCEIDRHGAAGDSTGGSDRPGVRQPLPSRGAGTVDRAPQTTQTSRSLLGRSVYLDALRAVALVRVVTYHVTGTWQLTAFTSLPLMFFVAGVLYAASLERSPAPKVVRSRYRRILIPYWGYAAAMVALWAAAGVLGQLTPAQWVALVLPVLSVDGVAGPDPSGALHVTWFALWYIQMHLVLALIGGPLRRAQRRWPRGVWVALAVLFVVAIPSAPGVAIAVVYTVAWMLGYLHLDGVLEPWLQAPQRWGRRWQWLCAVAGPLGAVAYLGFHHSNLAVAGVGALLLAAFWLVLALGVQPVVEPWIERRRARAVTLWFSRRSMTIYLWHGAALWLAIELVGDAGLLVRGLVTTAGVVVAVVAVGWLEDVAARRSPELWPRPASAQRTRGSGRATIDLRTQPDDRSGDHGSGAEHPRDAGSQR
jgi:peptidoglycan/LPS O-acetylase OafA/YrhL